MARPAFDATARATTPRVADVTHAYIHDQGWLCHGCRHRHYPPGSFDGDCAIDGCACPSRAPSLAEFEDMRTVVFAVEYTWDFPSVIYDAPPRKARPGAVH